MREFVFGILFYIRCLVFDDTKFYLVSCQIDFIITKLKTTKSLFVTILGVLVDLPSILEDTPSVAKITTILKDTSFKFS